MSPRGERLLLAMLLVGCAGVLGSGFGRGWSSDEVALVQPFDALEIFREPESSANPPLQRLLLNLLFSREDVLFAGRVGSLASTIGAVVALLLAARRTGGEDGRGHWLAIVLAGTNPLVVENATLVRSYAPWLLAASWHVLVLVRLADNPRSRPALLGLVLTSMVLPWIHYLSIPMLVLEGVLVAILSGSRMSRAGLAIVLPAVVASLPLVPLVLIDTARRSTGDIGQWPGMVFSVLSGGWPMGALLVVPWLLAMARAGATEQRRLLLASALAAMVALTLATPFLYIRRPSALFLLVPLLPLLLSAPLTSPWSRRFATGGPVALGLLGLLGLLFREQDPRDDLKAFAEGWHAWDRERGDDPVLVTPSYQVPPLLYTLTGQTLRTTPPSPRCPPEALCFETEGTLFRSILPGETLPPSLLVVLDGSGEATGCHLLEERGIYRLFRCP